MGNSNSTLFFKDTPKKQKVKTIPTDSQHEDLAIAKKEVKKNLIKLLIEQQTIFIQDCELLIKKNGGKLVIEEEQGDIFSIRNKEPDKMNITEEHLLAELNYKFSELVDTLLELLIKREGANEQLKEISRTSECNARYIKICNYLICSNQTDKKDTEVDTQLKIENERISEQSKIFEDLLDEPLDIEKIEEQKNDIEQISSSLLADGYAQIRIRKNTDCNLISSIKNFSN